MSVFGMVSAVAGFIRVRFLVDKANIDNMIFRAHYRITSAILFVCCIIVTANNLIGTHSLIYYTQIILFLCAVANFNFLLFLRISHTMYQRWRCAWARYKHVLLDNVHVYVTARTR